MSFDDKWGYIKGEWDKIKETIHVDSGITRISFDTWIKPLELYDFNDETVFVLIPSENVIAKNYIEKHYGIFFKVAFSEALDMPIDVEFILPKDIPKTFENTDAAPKEEILSKEDELSYSKKKETAAKNNIPKHDISSLTNSKFNQKYGFETFIVGPNNKFAYSASLAVAEAIGEVYNPLFLYGGAGLGKTHLMQAIGNYLTKNNPKARILYVTSQTFTNELIDSIRSKNHEAMSVFRDKYKKIDVLMVDDVQFIIGKESTQEEFFHIFNELYQEGKQIILSSDKPPREMATLEERLRSRFEMGLTVDILPPDYETRMAILQRYEAGFGKATCNEVLDYIASNIKSNIREIEGAYNKVVAFSKLDNSEITLDTAKKALRDTILIKEEKIITPQLIVNTVCEQFGITLEEITSRKRSTEIVVPRQIAMYLCRELTDASLVEIGKVLGKKDHTTVMSSINRIEARISVEKELEKNINIIRKKLNF